MAYGRSEDNDAQQGDATALFERNPATGTNLRALEESSAAASQQEVIDKGIAEAEEYANQSSTSQAVGQSRKPFHQRVRGIIKGKRSTKTPLIVLLVVLFGGGSIFGALFSPGIAVMQLAEAARELNGQLAAVDKTNAQLMRAKLKQTTTGSCGAIKIACKFKTVNIKKTEAMYKNTGISLEFNRDKGWGEGRGQIKRMTFVSPNNPNETLAVNGPEDYTRLMREHPEFRKAVIGAQNPRFLSLKNGAAFSAFRKNKTSPAKKLNGVDEKSLDQDVEKASSASTPLSKLRLVPETDEDGNETGRYIDEADNNKIYTADEAKGIMETEKRLANAPRASSVLANASKGVMVTGVADTACTVYNTSRAVSFAAKTVMAAELVRYSMIWLNLDSAMRAGDADPKQVEYAGKKLAEPDMREKIVDEGRLASTPEGAPLPMIDNPHYKKSGLDAEFYKMSAYQDIPKANFNTQLFILGGGLVGTLSQVNKTIARALGASSPREITQRCRMVQNPAVRGGALVIGIAAGLGSFGIGTAFSLAGSAALALSLPLLTAHLADIAAGRVTGPELEGAPMVNATMTGANVMYNDIFREQGAIPLSPERMVEYKNINRQAQVAYTEIDREAADDQPFDVTNQYSFFGSLARTAFPISQQFRTDGVAVAMAVPKIIGTAIGGLSPSANAAMHDKVSIERYQMCDDNVYKEMNVAADANCVLQYGLPKEALDAEPVEIATWMARQGEIDPDTGEAKKKDADWTYKKFLESCINQRPGAHEDPEASPDNGYGCASEKNYDKNWRYAKYTLSKNWNDTLDGDLPGLAGGSSTEFGSGAIGDVGEDGWAFPTTKDAITSSPYGPRGGGMHYGADLAQPGSADGKPIFAARDGKVVAAGPASGFGQWIVLQHEENGERIDTVYGHMYPQGVFVKQGDEVRAGQEIGKIGNNGQSSGPHLHFEIWKGGHQSFGGGNAIDPSPMLERSRTSSGMPPEIAV